jgi:hypothetical protein
LVDEQPKISRHVSPDRLGSPGVLSSCHMCHAHRSTSLQGRASDGSPSPDEHGDSVQPADNEEERSCESQTTGSLADLRDDAGTPREDATFYAAF